MSARRRFLAAALLVACAGCFWTTAPKGYLPTAIQAATEAFGGWMSVLRSDGTTTEGELLAASSDTIHVHTLEQWIAIPVADVKRVDLTGYHIPLASNNAWAVLGMMSTASHGGFLIISAPIWVIVGTASAAAITNTPRVRSIDPDSLRLYARFPQGLPEGIDRASIRAKPTPSRPEP